MWLKLKSSEVRWKKHFDFPARSGMRFFNMSSDELRTILRDGLGVSRQKAYDFWLARLKRVYGTSMGLEKQVTYVASILTKFSMLGLQGNSWLITIPELINLAEFENRDELRGFPAPPELFENAGQQLLFLSGFEEKDLFKKIAHIQAVRMGSFFFLKASIGHKREILLAMSDNFDAWQRRLSFLSHELQKNQADMTREVRASISIPRL